MYLKTSFFKKQNNNDRIKHNWQNNDKQDLNKIPSQWNGFQQGKHNDEDQQGKHNDEDQQGFVWGTNKTKSG